MKQTHWKKLIAPIIITVVIAAWYLTISALFLFLPEIPFMANLLIAALFAALAGVAIYVLLERIDEIRSGEEDDLSKY